MRGLTVTVTMVAVGGALAVSPVGFAAELFVGGADSIQAAVNRASPGDVIHISGAHAEQVIVTTDGLTLAGEPGATLTVPSHGIQTFPLVGTLPTAAGTAFETAGLVTIVGCGATVSGLTITGGGRYADFPALNGVTFVRARGAVLDCTIENFGDPSGPIFAGTDGDLGGSDVQRQSTRRPLKCGGRDPAAAEEISIEARRMYPRAQWREA